MVLTLGVLETVSQQRLAAQQQQQQSEAYPGGVGQASWLWQHWGHAVETLDLPA